ncbi:MAG TPA: hypothetical protein VIY47_14850, partial [Ignavibacteriaceae bacterium]
MFLHNFKFAPDGLELPSFLPFWASMLKQEAEGKFYGTGSTITPVVERALKGYASAIFMVHFPGSKADGSLVSAVCDFGGEKEEDTYRTYYSFQEDILGSMFSLNYVNNDYRNLLEHAVGFQKYYSGNPILFGEHAHKIDFNPAQLNLVLMYLMASSIERGLPDFTFEHVEVQHRSACKKWVENPSIKSELLGLCKNIRLDQSDFVLFTQIQRSLFENFCIQ